MGGKIKRAPLFRLPTTNEKIEKFINYLMKDWKKTKARKIFYNMLEVIKKSGHVNPIVVWEQAIENASPQVKVVSKRIWGAVYQIPVEVPTKKRFFYASKWIIEAARAKKGKPMYERLAEEVLAAYSNQWAAVKKKEDTHKMAEANKAFAYLAKYVK